MSNLAEKTVAERRATVLILENDAKAAQGLHELVTRLGFFATQPVYTGEAAAAAIRAHPPDALLVDFEFAEATDALGAGHQGLLAGIPLIFLTAPDMSPPIKQTRSGVPCFWLSKPVSERALAMALDLAVCRCATTAPCP